MTAAVIELVDVVKCFSSRQRPIRALDELSATVEEGQVTGLVGPDGAGKTTLMRLITCLIKPNSGSVRVLGMDSLSQAQEIQSSVGYMPQRFGLYEDLSVLENLQLYADLQGLAATERTSRFAQLMEFTGLGPFQRRLAGRLSGGMKQKLGLACSLVHPPNLLLLDEPSVGVDPVSRRELWDIVHALVGDGMSVLWATAYLDEAERCDNVLLLNEGKLLADGPPLTFVAGLRGRTFSIQAESAERRTVLREVRRLSHVVDAIIRGGHVRVLLSKDADRAYLVESCKRLQLAPKAIQQVDPVFEDVFISLLKKRPNLEPNQELDAGIHPDPSTAGGHKTMGIQKLPATYDGEPVIKVAGLVRKFGQFVAVDGVNFAVNRGQIFGLLGPNGAGKSTVFKMLCGLLPPTDGIALILGIDLRKAAPLARARIGYMAQKFSLYGNMSVMQNLRFFASAYGLSGHLQASCIDVQLGEFALQPYADALSADQPLGFKQRLALACATMHNPGVLFLDEPTSGVDPLVRREFWTKINAMASSGVTVMVTTHFMEEAEYCDSVGIIYRGRLVAAGTPENLKRDHRSTDIPDPTLEDAFVDLIKQYDREHPR